MASKASGTEPNADGTASTRGTNTTAIASSSGLTSPANNQPRPPGIKQSFLKMKLSHDIY